MHQSLTDWLASQATASPSLRGAVEKCAQACVTIAGLVDRAPLEGRLGALESENVQGEVQKALDVVANDVFLELCAADPAFAGMASEELDDVSPGTVGGEYLVAFDPLDGSSNTEVAMCVGSIFSILPAPAEAKGRPIEARDFLQPGRNQVAAGYALYGAQTMLVLSVGGDVSGFTLDRAKGAWVLTHPRFSVPEDSGEYAVNSSNLRHWEPGFRAFVEAMCAGKGGALGRDFNMRWLAAMVADVHRVLVRGGVFLYPGDTRPKVANGKLRLLYECAPMGFLIEKAGGAAYGAEGPILDITPEGLHQKSPVMLGSRNLLDRARREFLNA